MTRKDANNRPTHPYAHFTRATGSTNVYQGIDVSYYLKTTCMLTSEYEEQREELNRLLKLRASNRDDDNSSMSHEVAEEMIANLK